MIETITTVVFLGFWPAWLVWELVLLRLRATAVGQPPKTISMVARDLGWKCTALVYLWSGLAAHYWWNGSGYAPIVTGVVFWAIAVALAVWDLVALLTKTQQHWTRTPSVWLGLGLAAGRLLFPQAGALP